MDAQQISDNVSKIKSSIMKKLNLYSSQRAANEEMIKLLQDENEKLQTLFLHAQREYGEVENRERKLSKELDYVRPEAGREN